MKTATTSISRIPIVADSSAADTRIFPVSAYTLVTSATCRTATASTSVSALNSQSRARARGASSRYHEVMVEIGMKSQLLFVDSIHIRFPLSWETREIFSRASSHFTLITSRSLATSEVAASDEALV